MADSPAKVSRSRRWQRTSRPAGQRSLGLSGGGSTAHVIAQMQNGFPYTALVRFNKVSGLPVGNIAALIRIPQRTLMRRKASGRLHPEESERLLRVSGIFEKAVELFEGDTDAARRWLTAPHAELCGRSPLEFSRAEIGARDVEELIGRLEHGVFT